MRCFSSGLPIFSVSSPHVRFCVLQARSFSLERVFNLALSQVWFGYFRGKAIGGAVVVVVGVAIGGAVVVVVGVAVGIGVAVAVVDHDVHTFTPTYPALTNATTSMPIAATSAGPGAGESNSATMPAATAPLVKTGQAWLAASVRVCPTKFWAFVCAG